MIRDFDFKEFHKYDIQVSGSEMMNGELRFRLTSKGSTYIRTEARQSKGWQNSHYHSEQIEVFLVEQGSVRFAVLEEGKLLITKYSLGDCFSVNPMVPHSMLLSNNCITHCIKYGGNPDWNACPELDKILKGGMNNE